MTNDARSFFSASSGLDQSATDQRSAFEAPSRRSVLKGSAAAATALVAAPAFAATLGSSNIPATAFELTRSLADTHRFGDQITPWRINGVEVGSNRQPVSLILDTVRPLSWLALDRAKSGPVFDASSSDSFQLIRSTGAPDRMGFGSRGTLSGRSAIDSLWAKGAAGPRAIAYPLFAARGIWGRGLEGVDAAGSLSLSAAESSAGGFCERLMNAGLWDPSYPYVSIRLDSTSRRGGIRFGAVDFRGFDSERALTVNASNGGGWSGQVAIGASGSGASLSAYDLIIDTSLSKTMVPTGVFDALVARRARTTGGAKRSQGGNSEFVLATETVFGGRGVLRLPMNSLIAARGNAASSTDTARKPLIGSAARREVLRLGTDALENSLLVLEYQVTANGRAGGYSLSPKATHLFSGRSTPGALAVAANYDSRRAKLGGVAPQVA